MTEVISWLRSTELDRLGSEELAERIAQTEEEGIDNTPRHYPGYPTWPLPRRRRRFRPAFDTVMHRRRCQRTMAARLPEPNYLGPLLDTAHGVADELYRGPTPSAGNLQALELYLAHWQNGWLPPGVYHYDRRGHHLAQVKNGADEEKWKRHVPSLWQIDGGAMLWLIVGDQRRVAVKYGERGERFLLLEAGHLMQNLCLASESFGLSTVPLGGCLEKEIAEELCLPADDRVLYTGVCGSPLPERKPQR
jgi:SagB-type dehydrogenase family enzyme